MVCVNGYTKPENNKANHDVASPKDALLHDAFDKPTIWATLTRNPDDWASSTALV